MNSSSSGTVEHPLPEASSKARWIVYTQLVRGIFLGLFQLLLFPFFLVSRHRIQNQMKILIRGSKNISHSE